MIKRWWNNIHSYDREMIRDAVIAILALTLFISVCILAFTPIEYKYCKTKAETMEVNYQWKFFGGCFFEVEEGIFVHEDNYRYAEVGQ